MTIISLFHGYTHRVGNEIFPSGDLNWIISRIEKTQVAGQMAMVTAFDIYAINIVSHKEILWKQIVPVDYEEEYLIED